MVATLNEAGAPVRRARRLWLLVPVIASMIAFASWYFTASLTDNGANSPPVTGAGVAVADDVKPARQPLVWPEERLDGMAAKKLALEVVLAAAQKLNAIDGYTATLHKQERLKGALGPRQTLEIKVRQRPFAIYLKFLEPSAGKEVVYAEGHHDNKLIAHSGGLSRLLVPRLALAPDHPLALADSRHPVTEAGLAHLTSRLVRFRQLDLKQPDAETILDRVTDAKGRLRYRSIHRHRHHVPERPFAEVYVLYDPETLIPMDIQNFDWPEPGQEGALLLAEHYSYEGVDFDSGLTAVDFDPANPNYSFQRY
jgi:Protein of unknown function (DUF1571)